MDGSYLHRPGHCSRSILFAYSSEGNSLGPSGCKEVYGPYKELVLILWKVTFILSLFFSCSANVLLDLSFRAKVGDFGLARAIGGSHAIPQAQTVRVVGTSGYIAPEYFRGTITTKLDTYAFGVVREF